jgi:hypothetical protein
VAESLQQKAFLDLLKEMDHVDSSIGRWWRGNCRHHLFSVAVLCSLVGLVVVHDLLLAGDRHLENGK